MYKEFKNINLKKFSIVFLFLLFNCSDTVEISQSQKIWCRQTYNESIPLALIANKILNDELPGNKEVVLEEFSDDMEVLRTLEYVFEEIYEENIDISDNGTAYLLYLKEYNLMPPEAGFVSDLFENSENNEIQYNREQVCLLWYQVNNKS